MTPPLEGVAYIIPCGVWYISGDIIGCCEVGVWFLDDVMHEEEGDRGDCDAVWAAGDDFKCWVGNAGGGVFDGFPLISWSISVVSLSLLSLESAADMLSSWNK